MMLLFYKKKKKKEMIIFVDFMKKRFQLGENWVTSKFTNSKA